MRTGIGIGIPFSRVLGGIDPQAQVYYDRVIADGGIVSVSLATLSDYFKAVKQARGQSDINNCFLSSYHAPFGLKLAAGTGATAGNRACAKLYNLIGTTNDAEQTAPANQPLALVHSGSNYVYFPSVGGNFISTPNAAANQITGDLAIEAEVRPALVSGTQILIAKFATGSGAYYLRFSNNVPQLGLFTPANVETAYAATTNTGFSANQRYFIRVSRNSTTGIIKFFTSLDGVTFTQLGTDVAGFTGAIRNASSLVEIGLRDGSLAPFQGEIYNIKLFDNDTFTTPTQIFNPANYNRTTSQTTWTSTTGEVWTLNTPATNNALKAAIVDQTMVMGNGTSYGLRAANLNINQTAITSYTAFRKFVNTTGEQIINELGVSLGSAAGKYLTINRFTDREDTGIRANVGLNSSSFTSNSIALKLGTSVNNIANANESLPYLINNVAPTLAVQPSVANNTAAMNATGYNLLARNNAASLWANAILIGDAICAGEDSVGVRTAMYDIYKSLLKIA